MEDLMIEELRQRLKIPIEQLEAINAVLLDPEMEVINSFLEVVARYGTPEEINQKAEQARQLDALREKTKAIQPDYIKDLDWLTEQRDKKAFISEADYRRRVLGDQADTMNFKDEFAVTLELSACQYFPWVIEIAKRALERKELVPGRFIRVRRMKEQEEDGDLPAFAAAMQIIGSSFVETLDTKGTDGSNVHLGGPETITGYFGGVGQPNEHAIQWLDEYLYYYTTYGTRQVLNVNPGTMLLGILLHRLGVDMEYKISVYTGHDNPYAALWTLFAAKIFAREDGTTPLIGFNWSNSVNNQTMEITDQFRKSLGFENVVRYEHHIVETYKSIVIQPYNRREELLEIADHVANISAKHEGADPEIDVTREHPSDILDYFREKKEIIASGDWDHLTLNLLDKFDALNKTAWQLTERGLSFIAAPKLHHV
jgi:hypothetical protein